MHRHTIIALLASAALAGCSSGGNGVSTASVLSSAPTPPPAGAAAPANVVAVPAPAPSSTATERAFQVGAVSARAQKCGYNFDVAKLKASYLAHEVGRGSSNEEIANVEKIYGVSYNGVMKAAADEANFCSERKTAQIKTDLNRLLAGDFEPPRKAVVAEKKDEGGLFSGWFSNESTDSGPKFGSGDWWEKQREASGQ